MPRSRLPMTICGLLHSPVRLAPCFVLLGVLLTPAIARADDEAESLYRDGKKAAQAKDWSTACARFKASAEREPAPGTLLNLGDCEEHRGHLRDARASFESSVKLFKPGDERASYAKQRLAAIERKIPKLTAKLQVGSPGDARIDLDGAPLASKDAVALEPGEHVLVVRAPGRSDVESRITLAESENRTVVLTVGSRTASDVPVSTTHVTSAVMPESPRGHGAALRTTGWVGLGLGAAGLATGLVAGWMTMSAKVDADDHCPRTGCDADGLSAQREGKTWSTVSTAAFIGGGVLTAAGLGILLFGPSSRGAVGLGPGTVSYGATF